jgi:hypothetical protein
MRQSEDQRLGNPRLTQPSCTPDRDEQQAISDADHIMECPAQGMFARHRLGLPDVCLNELALRHTAQPTADHFPVGRYAEHALHQEGIEIEDDRAADTNQCGPEDDVGCGRR